MIAQMLNSIREHPLIASWVGSASSISAGIVGNLDQVNAVLTSISLFIGIIMALLALPSTVEKFIEWAKQRRK